MTPYPMIEARSSATATTAASSTALTAGQKTTLRNKKQSHNLRVRARDLMDMADALVDGVVDTNVVAHPISPAKTTLQVFPDGTLSMEREMVPALLSQAGVPKVDWEQIWDSVSRGWAPLLAKAKEVDAVAVEGAHLTASIGVMAANSLALASFLLNGQGILVQYKIGVERRVDANVVLPIGLEMTVKKPPVKRALTLRPKTQPKQDFLPVSEEKYQKSSVAPYKHYHYTQQARPEQAPDIHLPKRPSLQIKSAQAARPEQAPNNHLPPRPSLRIKTAHC